MTPSVLPLSSFPVVAFGTWPLRYSMVERVTPRERSTIRLITSSETEVTNPALAWVTSTPALLQFRAGREQPRRSRRLGVGGDEIAVARRLDQRLPFEGSSSLVKPDFAHFPQSGERARAVIELARFRRMREQNLRAACWRSAASLR